MLDNPVQPDNTHLVAALRQACKILDVPLAFTNDDLLAYKHDQGTAPYAAIPRSKFRHFVYHLVLQRHIPLDLNSIPTNIATPTANGIVSDAITAAHEHGVYLLITSEGGTSHAYALHCFDGSACYLYDGAQQVDTLTTEDHQRSIQLERLARLLSIRRRKRKRAANKAS